MFGGQAGKVWYRMGPIHNRSKRRRGSDETGSVLVQARPDAVDIWYVRWITSAPRVLSGTKEFQSRKASDVALYVAGDTLFHDRSKVTQLLSGLVQLSLQILNLPAQEKLVSSLYRIFHGNLT